MEGKGFNWKLEFANVWEDSNIDLSVLEPKTGANIVCVTSAGCTVLALLSKGATVTAVDSNPAQNALLELKLSAARVLGYKEWRSFLGREEGGDRLSAYAKTRERLSENARSFWDERHSMLSSGILDQGTIENILRTARRFYHRFVNSPASCERWFDLRDLEAQRQYYRDSWDTWRRRLFLRLCVNPMLFRRSSPTANQYAHIHRTKILNAVVNRLEHAMTAIPTATNYFLSRLLLGRFLNVPDGEPNYLGRPAYEVISQVRERLTVHTDNLIEILERMPPETFNGFALSNVVDWLSPGAQERLLTGVVHSAAPGARLCIRSVQSSWLPPTSLQPFLDTGQFQSESFLSRERSFVYGTVYAAIVQHKRR